MYFNKSGKTKYYDETDCIDPRNPSRGLYVMLDSANAAAVELFADEVSLFLVAYDIYDFRNMDISDEKLEELRNMLETVKEHHAKVIFRAAYGFEIHSRNDADSLARIGRHIEQIAPILNEYKAQIYCVQAGWFGPWGEWHSSAYTDDDLDDDDCAKNRTWLVQEVLAALDEEIPLCLRRPDFIKEAKKAGCDIDRLGFFNDGLFGDESDLGTFEEGEREKTFKWVHENVTAPMGGEMPEPGWYSNPENADTEFRILNASYLNMHYNEVILNSWKNKRIDTDYGGMKAYDYITNRLGYRFRVESVIYPDKIASGRLKPEHKIELRICNDGYAPIARGYRFEWVLERTDGELIRIPNDAEKTDKRGFSLLSRTNTDDVYVAELKARMLTSEISRVGFRIYKEGDPLSDEDCVRVVNRRIEYEDGIHYLLSVSESGKVSAE